ncbi:DUF1835 domain-containing protein [Larkinella terrae]|uniref:DUF1835 domain-containing protein n=1 Tax=Larkinella terrae TaxID=2025311 RepID=A0A7K0EJ76_9BACT|nr:DUF1835 domain-containing protein [Larkinella terrae]MRS61920.1 DUF1835 domain-containing protein [Larkinella terrae]
MKILHILNGDSTAVSFADANILGKTDQAEVAVWREALSEGPVNADVSLNELWDIRRAWHKVADEQPQPEKYNQLVVQEFEKIANPADYEEIYLWFEHDLFCQINLVFLLAQLGQRPLGTTRIKQVSVDSFPGVPFFKGIGELNGAQLATLFLQAEELTQHELELALKVWNAYAGPDPLEIQKLLGADFGRLRFLKTALTLHLQRFPFTENRLNLIEHLLTATLMEGPMPESDLIGRFLKQDRVYGITDLSIGETIRQLNGKLWAYTEEGVGLTETGADIIAGRRTLNPVERWLGGFYQTGDSPYRWDRELEKLIEL